MNGPSLEINDNIYLTKRCPDSPCNSKPVNVRRRRDISNYFFHLKFGRIQICKKLHRGNMSGKCSYKRVPDKMGVGKVSVVCAFFAAFTDDLLSAFFRAFFTMDAKATRS